MTKARQGNRPGSPDPTGKFPDHDQREKGGNNHPTVKPLALMRYLARLTKTPTGGVVLDPFAGSGSTGCAAVMEGRGFIGIEIDEDYADIARARIAKAAEQARQLTLGIEQAA
jgi:DNA modification methylase